MNLTRQLLNLVVKALRLKAEIYDAETRKMDDKYASTHDPDDRQVLAVVADLCEALTDAADALDDAIEMLTENNDL